MKAPVPITPLTPTSLPPIKNAALLKNAALVVVTVNPMFEAPGTCSGPTSQDSTWGSPHTSWDSSHSRPRLAPGTQTMVTLDFCPEVPVHKPPSLAVAQLHMG